MWEEEREKEKEGGREIEKESEKVGGGERETEVLQNMVALFLFF